MITAARRPCWALLLAVGCPLWIAAAEAPGPTPSPSPPTPVPGPTPAPPAPTAASTPPPAATAAAAAASAAPATPALPAGMTLHAQSTVVLEHHDDFPAAYTGPLSLQPDEGRTTTLTGTLFAGYRLWAGTEVYADPEVAGGTGFSNVNGLAAFPNGEISRVGTVAPSAYLARLFLRETIGFGGTASPVDDGQNQVAGTQASRRVVITIGKFAANDLFDGNAVAHDPRSQFANWALMDQAAWDYPADVRGYVRGVVGELYRDAWALRLGLLQEPTVANGADLEPSLRRARSLTSELERDWHTGLGDGAVRWLVYANRAHMGNYRAALDAAGPGGTPDVTATRAYRTKWGGGLSADQALGRAAVFLRAGWNDGHTESWAFTAVDRSLSGGARLRPLPSWRPQDVLAAGVFADGLSQSHRAYLAAGGLDFNLGDGRLRYGWEEGAEVYYAAQVTSALQVTPELQGFLNPGYNRDRGPVWLWGLRGHLEY